MDDGWISLRLRAQDAMGIQVVCETAIGMGIFAGDAIGIGDRVRTLSCTAMRRVLEEDTFHCIKVVLFALPVFKPKRDNYHWLALPPLCISAYVAMVRTMIIAIMVLVFIGLWKDLMVIKGPHQCVYLIRICMH